ncbi:MAG: alpha/beta hydrolase [Burkholderiales bacterium]
MPHVFETVTIPAATFTAGLRTPVVMLHASLSCKSQWNPLVERLGARYEPVSLDLVGYGTHALPPPASAFTIDDEVRHVERQLKAVIGARPFHLVGHSYGALVALRLAQRQPARVASLSLYEPAALRLLGDDDAAYANLHELAERVQRHIGAGRNQDAAQAFVDYWSGRGYFSSLPMTTRHAIAKRVAKVVLDFQASLRWPAQASDLRVIATPTLLLVGTEGHSVTHRIAGKILAAMPDSSLRACESGHLGPIDAPAAVNPSIEAFIDECERAAHRRTRTVAA